MEYLTVKETAEKWGYSEGTIRKWCRLGLLKTTVEAELVNNRWRIPVIMECPKKVKK